MRNPPPEHSKFKKGQTGNPNGRPKLPDLKLLMDEILGEEKDGKTAAFAILAALRAKAAKGDIRAAELLFNRGWGMPKQAIDHSGEIKQRIVIEDHESNSGIQKESISLPQLQIEGNSEPG